MKKYFVIVCLFLLAGFTLLAQDDDGDDDRGGKLQQRMREYVQKRLNLSKGEAERFSPIFLRYIVELRRTHRENKADKPVLQLRVAEVRVKFRNQFREVMDEQRANRVFEYQREFEDKIRQEILNRRQEGKPTLRRNKMLMQ
jgi:hypothetical protein